MPSPSAGRAVGSRWKGWSNLVTWSAGMTGPTLMIFSLPVLSKNVPPADHTSAVAIMWTPLRKLPPVGPPGLGLGAGTRVQEVPFQCSTRVLPRVVVPPTPTAHMSLAETALTPVRPLIPGLGADTRAHFVPFQCSTRVADPELVLEDPTAQASVREISATPDRKLPNAPGAGVGTCAQLVPFQCSASVLWVRLRGDPRPATGQHESSGLTQNTGIFPAVSAR
jgi:hypothetical protein